MRPVGIRPLAPAEDKEKTLTGITTSFFVATVVAGKSAFCLHVILWHGLLYAVEDAVLSSVNCKPTTLLSYH